MKNIKLRYSDGEYTAYETKDADGIRVSDEWWAEYCAHVAACNDWHARLRDIDNLWFDERLKAGKRRKRALTTA